MLQRIKPEITRIYKEGVPLTLRAPSDKGPEILEMPAQKMAAVYARGEPQQVFARVLPDLYSSVYFLNVEHQKRGIPSYEIGSLRVRYPDAHLVPISEWTHVIGLPIPEATSSLPQKVGGNEIKIETWEYGTVAQILYSGSSEGEIKAVEILHQYIIDSGYTIIGVHEEEYLTNPDGGSMNIYIRYRITKK
jgi:effector-binding domain-containing protein